LCLPHAVIGPRAHVVGVGGERLLVPELGVVVVAELAMRVADVVRDVRMLVVAERVHRGDAVLVTAAENQKSRRAVVVQKFLLRELSLLLFDHIVLLLFLFLAAAVVGRRRRIV